MPNTCVRRDTSFCVWDTTVVVTGDGWGGRLSSLQALKILKKSFLKRKREFKKVAGKMVFCNALDKVQREVAIMKKLSHANLVKLFEV